MKPGNTPQRDNRLSFSDEFIGGLRARWNERRRSTSATEGERAAPSEPIYDGIYEEALGLMDDDEGMTPTPPRRHPLGGPEGIQGPG